MRLLAVIELAVGGVGQIPCPVGKRMRIVSIIGSMTVSASDDQWRLQFTRGAETQAVVSFPPIPAGAGLAELSAHIGATTSANLATIVDPVTGVVAYVQNVATTTASLPDIWWQWAIDISFASGGSSFDSGRAIYELDEIAFPRRSLPERSRKRKGGP